MNICVCVCVSLLFAQALQTPKKNGAESRMRAAEKVCWIIIIIRL